MRLATTSLLLAAAAVAAGSSVSIAVAEPAAPATPVPRGLEQEEVNSPPGVAARFPHVVDQLAPRQQPTCSGPVAGSPRVWWRAQIGHNGTTPMSSDPTFQYYRTATQFGADNTGIRDASDAFNLAIDAWARTGNTVTTRPAYVYVPSGRYRIKRPIQMLVNTFLVGDALDPPTLIADPALLQLNDGAGGPVIHGFDAHQGDGSPTKNFYMTVRNLRIDTSELPAGAAAVAVDWSVSQACSFANVHIVMPPGSSHIGMTMKQGGSGILISDSTFTGGAVGIHMSSQQYQFKGLKFDGCGVGLSLSHAFVAVLQDMTFSHCDIGIDMGADGIGAVSLVDSTVTSCRAAVNARVSGAGQGSLVLDSVRVSGSYGGAGAATVAVRSTENGTTLLAGSVAEGQVWVMGNANPHGYQQGRIYPVARSPALLAPGGGKYFTAPLPQYEKFDISEFVSVTDDPAHKVFGDNVHDDGPAINAILRKHAGCKIVFFPQGIYLTRETIYVPPGSRLVGEVFSTISGSGPNFADANSPRPVLEVGKPGERGIAQLSDMLISVAEVLPGAILAQVNMAGDKPGDVAMWNVVYRVGGSADSSVSTKCSNPNPVGCKAAFALLHVGKTASAYFEGVWGWVADHGLDPKLPAQNIAVGRGVLVESTAGTWLVGTSFEHCVLYQYSLVGAANVYLSLEQTEAPYWQGLGTKQRAPAPWSVNSVFGDPNFTNCATQNASVDDQCFRSWGHFMINSSQVVVHGGAHWSFFNAMNDNKWRDPQCGATTFICQLNMAYTAGSRSAFLFSFSSKSTAHLIYDDDDNSVASQEHNPGSWPPRGAVLAAYLRRSDLPDTGNGTGPFDGVGAGGGDGGSGACGGGKERLWGSARGFPGLAVAVVIVLGFLV